MGIILVTGANGFVGSALCRALREDGLSVRGAVRSVDKAGLLPEGVEPFIIGEIGPHTGWAGALEGVDAVIHLAGTAHNYQNLKDRYEADRLGTERLAKQAAQSKAQLFIYLSTIKVNGEYSPQDEKGNIISFNEESVPDSQGNYAIGKWKAEQALARMKEDSGMGIIILRSPLVYGPEVKANFFSLLKLVDAGIPLPLAGVRNKRSLIYLGNLTDIILRCLSEPRAYGQTFLVSDGHDISTPELIREIAKSLGRKPRFFPFPLGLLKFAGKITGRLSKIERLTSSLAVDNRKISRALNWEPPFSLEQGIRLTVEAYKSTR